MDSIEKQKSDILIRLLKRTFAETTAEAEKHRQPRESRYSPTQRPIVGNKGSERHHSNTSSFTPTFILDKEAVQRWKCDHNISL